MFTLNLFNHLQFLFFLNYKINEHAVKQHTGGFIAKDGELVLVIR